MSEIPEREIQPDDLIISTAFGFPVEQTAKSYFEGMEIPKVGEIYEVFGGARCKINDLDGELIEEIIED